MRVRAEDKGKVRKEWKNERTGNRKNDTNKGRTVESK